MLLCLRSDGILALVFREHIVRDVGFLGANYCFPMILLLWEVMEGGIVPAQQKTGFVKGALRTQMKEWRSRVK